MICQQDRFTVPTPRDAAIASLPPGAYAPEAPVIYDVKADTFRFVTQANVDEMQASLIRLALGRAVLEHDLDACHDLRRSGASPV